MSTQADTNFHRTVTDWPTFQEHWGGLHNFLMTGSLARCDYALPPLERIIEEVRHDKAAIVRSGVKGDIFDLTEIKDEFLRLPLEQAMQSRFVLAHFGLHPNLTGRGQVFEGLEEQWVEPWRAALLAHGFSFERVFPILFASGPHSASNYHLDYTHQLAWQCYGTKHFHGLKDPERWTTYEQRRNVTLVGMQKPAGITPGDTFAVVQSPGTLLWNAVITPHWVETHDGCAATLTLVHAGLRLHGALCPQAAVREEWLAAQPAQAA